MKHAYLAVIAGAACISYSPSEASHRFTYKLQLDPFEGPLTPAVQKRYTAQWAACQERAVSTQDNENCMAAEFARQDRKLNEVWRRTLARFSATSRRRLILAQRQWVFARDPFCVREADQFGSGTIMPIVYTDCRIELTIRRMMWLEKL